MTTNSLYLPQNAKTAEQRVEVLRRLGEAWEECPFLSLCELIARAIDGADLHSVRDTELVESAEGYAGGGTDRWDAFDNNTPETRAWPRAQALNPETRHTVDINELRRLGVMSDDQRWHAFDWFNGEPSTSAGDFWVTHAMNVARQTHDLAFKAVNAWAEQMQMTPDEWLKRWVPVAEHKYKENDYGGLELKIVISAQARPT